MNKVIITGAANGIGKAIALELHRQRAQVFACDIDKKGLEQLARLMPGTRIFHLDITDHTAVSDLFAEINNVEYNWLVNNAGIYPGKNILDYTPEYLQQIIKVNCIGAIYFTQFFGKKLIQDKRHGAIVNVSSISGQHGSSDAIYGMTKAAIVGLTKSTAINFAPFIRVNAVAPGLVETSILKKIPAERYQKLRSNELVSEHILPSDIAASVGFLLSNAARNITGMTLDINNGQYIR